MAIDTSATLEIRGSPWKMLGLCVLGAGMTLLSAAIAFDMLPGANPGLIARILGGWLGLVFFGACTVLIAFRALTTTGPVVKMSRDGITDTRVARRPIPWSAIRGISTWSHQGQQIMVLDVDPAIEAELGLTAMTRWTRKANRALGADGLCIASQGLAIGYDEMLGAAVAFAGTHGTRSAA